MPSSQTPNYNLNQWSRDDRVLMEDFNADNAKIDAALGEKADKSAVEELNAQVGQVELSMPRVVFGTYTGDGAASKHIELGFPPKALLLFCQNGRTSYCVSYGMAYGGLALEGHPVIIQNREVLTLNSSGFTVRKEFQEKAASLYSNADGVFYHYIAFA